MAEPIVPLEPVGYEALIRSFGIALPPHFRRSFVGARARTTERIDHHERHIYPLRYRPKPPLLDGHLEFALKYEGLNLAVLKAVFGRAPRSELERYISSRPTGQYARRVWFLHEWLTGQRLELPDASSGNYVDVLDPHDYFTVERRPSPRHRVHDNLPGTRAFCPLVRRTERLELFEKKKLAEKARAIVATFAPDIIERATEYLYLKETRSSYAIERETPDQNRTARFIEILRRAHEIEQLDQTILLELQSAIVDHRFADRDYRGSQNYVSETRPDFSQRVHFVSPKPSDVADLMRGLFECHRRLAEAEVDPVVHAALVSFGFVFLHPFQDGNGRIHRFLIHQILSRRGFTPPGLILPVSAAMLARRRSYDEALESFSKPLMELVQYEVADDGVLTVRNETADLYRYFDATSLCEYLYRVLEETLEHEFVEEIRFIIKHDQATAEMREVVDLPNRQLILFFKTCLQNQGRLSKTKRESLFSALTDDEVRALESIIRRVMLGEKNGGA